MFWSFGRLAGLISGNKRLSVPIEEEFWSKFGVWISFISSDVWLIESLFLLSSNEAWKYWTKDGWGLVGVTGIPKNEGPCSAWLFI